MRAIALLIGAVLAGGPRRPRTPRTPRTPRPTSGASCSTSGRQALELVRTARRRRPADGGTLEVVEAAARAGRSSTVSGRRPSRPTAASWPSPREAVAPGRAGQGAGGAGPGWRRSWNGPPARGWRWCGRVRRAARPSRCSSSPGRPEAGHRGLRGRTNNAPLHPRRQLAAVRLHPHRVSSVSAGPRRRSGAGGDERQLTNRGLAAAAGPRFVPPPERTTRAASRAAG
jgi:hypothetical protein